MYLSNLYCFWKYFRQYSVLDLNINMNALTSINFNHDHQQPRFIILFHAERLGKKPFQCMLYVLSCGTVTAISRWHTYSKPMGPTTFVEIVSSCDAESRNTGWLRYSVLVSGGGSSWTTPCTINTIL